MAEGGGQGHGACAGHGLMSEERRISNLMRKGRGSTDLQCLACATQDSAGGWPQFGHDGEHSWQAALGHLCINLKLLKGERDEAQ